MDLNNALYQLQTGLESIPPVKAMQVEVVRFESERLYLSAPLMANVNDKGCAFGGSLVSIMTICGWGVVTLKLQLAGLEAEVYVADSTVRYLAPLYDDLQVWAGAEEDEHWDDFTATFKQCGRARINIMSEAVLAGGGAATQMQAHYVVKAKS